MATRHQVRQAVVSLLYAREMGSEMVEFPNEFLEEKKIRNKQKDFTNELFNGILTQLSKIDEILNQNLSECKIDEIGIIEREILPLGVYEICFTNTDKAVAINEAVELAKEMANENTTRLINGVLDKINNI